MKRSLLFVAMVLAACTSSTTQQTTQIPQHQHGLAAWYGQEFAGRTTADGEIFDPMLMTAAHRTLPFGTLVDVKNPHTGQTVRVRINDRGPYVQNRIIDLSYAAAQQIGLAETAGGDVDLTVVKLGSGEREPPAPLVVTIPDATAPAPAPVVATTTAAPPPVPVTVENVQVTETHQGVETRRQVAPGGKSVEVVPVTPQPQKTATVTPPSPKPVAKPAPAPAPASAPATRRANGRYVVQVGAFSIEANAKALQERLAKIGQEAWIDHTSLYRVRIGPFATREEAIKIRERLENAGVSAIIVVE